jgi:alkylhydroperoxidase family enzyme
MGHTEMILAVAGLDELALKEQVSKLASCDWSSFKPAERAGLHFARKLTKTPWDIGQADIEILEAHLGPEHALDAIWYVCWCNYMTRVADAFQIPLERENVFMRPKPAPAYVPVLADADAWKQLPPVQEGYGQPLPVWIRALAGPLPKTAAAMLNWDYVQRVESPLAPHLRAKLRWMTAYANHCEYAKAYARADYLRVGGRPEDIDELPHRFNQLPEGERSALQIMRQLAEAAHTITDAQMERLITLHGEEQVAAMVLLSAYANFQDRLLLGLGVSVEPTGPLAPVKVRFVMPAPTAGPTVALKNGAALTPPKKGPERKLTPGSPNPPAVPEKIEDPEWTSISVDTLRELMKQQIARPKARIRLPDPETVQAKLPVEMPQPDKQVQIVWYLATFGYQPRLTRAWMEGGRAFREDSEFNRVHGSSLFWIVTRSCLCFY